jgi:predicted secreted protein
MAKAGYKCLIRRSGAPTTVSLEACENVSGSVYRVTSSAKRCIDTRSPWHLTDSGGTVPWGDISAADFLFGEFTVAAVTGSLTFTGTYLPLTTASEVIQEAMSFSLSESNDLLDVTVFNGGADRNRKRIMGLGDASLSVEGFWSASDHASLATLHASGGAFLFEVNSGASQLFRGWARMADYSRDGSVDGILNRSISLELDAQRDDATGFYAAISDRLL